MWFVRFGRLGLEFWAVFVCVYTLVVLYMLDPDNDPAEDSRHAPSRPHLDSLQL